MLTPAELVWLIAAVAKGDEAAFERLYAATRAKLFGVVLRILRRQDLAEEVIQEAYVKIWNSAGQFNPGQSSPITWMASIARNRAIDVVRKRREASIEDEPAAMEVAADTPDPLAPRATGGEIRGTGKYSEDMAASQHDGYQGVSRTLNRVWMLNDGL